MSTLGTGNNLTYNFDGTDTLLTFGSGDFTLDNTNTTGAIVVQLGTDDANTSFQVRNNSDANILEIFGNSVILVGSLGNWTFNGDDGGLATDTDLITLAANLLTINGTIRPTTSYSLNTDIEINLGTGNDFLMSYNGVGFGRFAGAIAGDHVFNLHSTGEMIIQLPTNDTTSSFRLLGFGALIFRVDGDGTITPAGPGTGNWVFTNDFGGLVVDHNIIDLALNLITFNADMLLSDNVRVNLVNSATYSMLRSGANTLFENVIGHFTLANDDATSDTKFRCGTQTVATGIDLVESGNTNIITFAGNGKTVAACRIMETWILTNIIVAANTTYTAAQVLTGFIFRDPMGANRVDTFPTRASILALIKNPVAGLTFFIRYRHRGGSVNTVQLLGNTGVVIGTVAGTLTLAQDQAANLYIRDDGATMTIEHMGIFQY